MLGLLTLVACLATGTTTAQATPACGDGHLPLRFTEVRRDLAPPMATIEVAVQWVDGHGHDTAWLEDGELDAVSWYYLQVLGPWGVRHIRLVTPAPRNLPGVAKRGELLSLDALLRPKPPVPQRPWERLLARPAPRAAPAPAIVGQPWAGSKTGALAGKSVYVSPGHGWYWSTVLGRWATQRGNTHDIVEDFVNAEGAMHYLVPLLRNAGANVVGVRELDMRPEMALVDDDSPAGYSETGSWQKGAEKGFSSGKAPYKGNTNPFALGSYRVSKVSTGKATATATWTAQIPKPGQYTVYIGYTAGTNRAADAHFEVQHAGGVSVHRINQRRHGQTWTALGQFWFDKSGVVRLFNDSKGPSDRYVVADVVRFGGGQGEIVRGGTGKPPAKGPTSGRPRWEECARYYTQFAGAPSTVWDSSNKDNNDDVSARSRFAAWHHEAGEDAVYFSWHSNAPDPARGTSTYVYGPNPPNGSKNFQGVKGSAEFGALLQKHLVADIRAEYDPNWKDRGLYSAYFGEVNPKYNPEMPAALIEGAFHSTKADADYLREPRFRHLMARAIVKAIISYFAQRDKIAVKLPPEPPTALRLASDGTLQWSPGKSGGVSGDAAQKYIVQTSTDGRAFDVGVVTDKTTFALSMPTQNVPLFARVVALNAGGVSTPSSVVGASAGCDTGPDVLLVDGFTRLQASQMPVENLASWSLGNIQRLRQWRMNGFDYSKEWLDALAHAGRSVASTQRAGFAGLQIPSSVRLIAWAAGEQSTQDGVLDKTERDALTAWLQLGDDRAVLLSGAEVTWALDKKGSKSSADWLATWFGARYEEDDAGVYGVTPAAGASLSWAGGTFDDGDGHAYDVDWPDVLKLVGASALLDYADGKGVAASRYAVGKATTVLMGFPLETIETQPARRTLMAALLTSVKTPAPFAQGCGSSVADGGQPDAGSTPDAGSLDAGDAGAIKDGDGAADAGVPPDGVAFDGSAGTDGVSALDGLTGPDGSVPSDASNGSKAAPDGGCGCSVRRDATLPSGGTALLLLTLAAVMFWRRRGLHR